MNSTTWKTTIKTLKPEQIFMVSTIVVNAGNYFYNLILGRILGPKAFADAALLITLLLMLSFLGMTFQIVTAKYAVLFQGKQFQLFLRKISRIALVIGFVLSICFGLGSSFLKDVLNTSNSAIFIIFSVGIPIYFFMSVNRGIYQGKDAFNQLSLTYQSEMVSRLILTLVLLLLFPFLDASIVVASCIVLSFILGVFPFKRSYYKSVEASIKKIDFKPVITFLLITAFYEFTQIIINNSDIILVKHYFENHQAGLYASLALIGRVVYFMAWMFVMILLPKVIRRKQEGLDTLPILFKYVGYIGLISVVIILATLIFPELIVKLMFGEAYLSVSNLLWQYAVATALFALANIFAYYFLSLKKYIPVVISGLLGLTQIGLIMLFHRDLKQVIAMQIIAMSTLLLFQIVYFIYQNKSSVQPSN